MVRFYCIIPPIPTAKQLHFSTQQTYEVLMTTHSPMKSVENVLKKRPLDGSWVHFCQQWWWWEMYIKWSVANKSVHGCLSSLLDALLSSIFDASLKNASRTQICYGLTRNVYKNAKLSHHILNGYFAEMAIFRGSLNAQNSHQKSAMALLWKFYLEQNWIALFFQNLFYNDGLFFWEKVMEKSCKWNKITWNKINGLSAF